MSESSAISGEIVRLYIEGVLCACSSISVSYDIDNIPEINFTMPATSGIAQALAPRLRVDVLLMDPSVIGGSLLVSFSEGEILDYSFYKSASGQRSFSARAAHFTHAWLNVPIQVLSVDDQVTETIKGKDIYQTKAEGINKGTVYEFFSPSRVQDYLKSVNRPYKRPDGTSPIAASESSSNYAENFNVYDYAAAGAQLYEVMASNSATKDSYDFQALNLYKPSERFFYPSGGSQIKWDFFFQNLIALYYSGILGGQGGEMTYLNAIRQVLSILLHELIIIPNTRTPKNNIITKPILAFSPIPRCNLILPIFSPTFEWGFSHASKPTRLIQYTTPPMMKDLPPALARYYRNVAPAELKEKFDKYDAKLEENKQPAEALQELVKEDNNFSLVTEEEKRRGIIVSTNDIPSYMSTAISVLYPNGGSVEQRTTTGASVKTSVPIKDQLSSSGSSPTDLSILAQEAIRVAVYDEMLKEKERTVDRSGATQDSTFLGLKNTFVPKRFIIISYTDSYYTSYSSFLRPHYTILTEDDKIAVRNVPRYFGVFAEAVHGLPKILHFDDLTTELSNNTSPTRANSPYFTFLDTKNQFSRSSSKFKQRIGNIDTTSVSVKTSLDALTGYPDKAIIIYIPQKDLNNPVAFRNVSYLIALLSKVIEPQITIDASTVNNVIFSYKELAIDDSSSANFASITSQQLEGVRKTVITTANSLEEEFKKRKKDRDQSIGITKALKQLSKTYKQEEEVVLANYYSKITNYIIVPEDETEESYTTTTLEENNLKEIRDKYTQPVCNFFFYYNRFSGSGRNVPISFNPYVVPGFSCLLLDIANEEYPIHILSYLTRVVHEFSATSISTVLSLSLMRRIDDFSDNALVSAKGSKTGDIQALDILEGGTGAQKIKTISQSISNMPFYGGEWAGSNINKTIEELFGKMGNTNDSATVKLNEVIDYVPENDPKDIVDAFNKVKRSFPVVQIQARYLKTDNSYGYISMPDMITKLQSVAETGSGSLLDIAPGINKRNYTPVIPGIGNSEDFKNLKKTQATYLVNALTSIRNQFALAPSNVIALYDLTSIGLIEFDPGKFPENIQVTGIPAFESGVRAFIEKHTELCRNRTGIIGGDKI